MTIPEILKREGRWPDTDGPWGYVRTFTAETITVADLCHIAYRLKFKPGIKFEKREATDDS